MTERLAPSPPHSSPPDHGIRFIGVAATILVLVVGGIAGTRPRRTAIDVERGLTTFPAFEAALDDVLDIEPDPSEIVDDLWALVPETPHSLWESGRVLVSTWTAYDGYSAGEPTKLKRDVWVVPVPQVLDRCRAFGIDPPALDHRLRQYLGLRPRTSYDRIVEFWVDPNTAFRPCPDPEVTDRSCRAGLPIVPNEASEPQPTGRTALEHARWFQTQYARYLDRDTSAPWTRLGYTYDWGDPSNEIGASEYVVPQGTTIVVASITPTAEYCSLGPTRMATAEGTGVGARLHTLTSDPTVEMDRALRSR